MSGESCPSLCRNAAFILVQVPALSVVTYYCVVAQSEFIVYYLFHQVDYLYYIGLLYKVLRCPAFDISNRKQTEGLNQKCNTLYFFLCDTNMLNVTEVN